MRHVIAWLAFIVALYFAFAIALTLGRVDREGFLFATIWMMFFGLPSIVALAIYYLLFRARMWATALLGAIAVGSWVAFYAGLVGESGMVSTLLVCSVAAAGLVHHVILNLFGNPEARDA
jgi:hypothetical protein